MCEFCETGKNLFLTRECFREFPDTSEMVIKRNGIVVVASEDTHSIYGGPTRTIRRIEIRFCPMCGRKLIGSEE